MEGCADLYAERWRIETAIGDLETRLRGGADVDRISFTRTLARIRPRGFNRAVRARPV
jgi:hypothetical protein